MFWVFILGAVLAAFFTYVSAQIEKPDIRAVSTAIFVFYLLLSIYGAMRI